MHFPTLIRLTAAVLLSVVMTQTVTADHHETEHDAKLNTLTQEEAAQGWTLLFDGETISQWRGYKQEDVPEGWAVVDGGITRVGPGGDLITREQFDDFELTLEWRISGGGNSGIFYNGSEEYDNVYESAPEMQILDNSTHNDGENTLTRAGANYALHPPAVDATNPVGEFNLVRILVQGNHVEHHLNGQKLLEYVLGSDEWKALVAASKFKDMPGYGRAASGHIALQDHGDLVDFRNIKIRIPQAAQSQPATQGDE